MDTSTTRNRHSPLVNTERPFCSEKKTRCCCCCCMTTCSSFAVWCAIVRLWARALVAPSLSLSALSGRCDTELPASPLTHFGSPVVSVGRDGVFFHPQIPAHCALCFYYSRIWPFSPNSHDECRRTTCSFCLMTSKPSA